jgi:hypothetical protein
VVLIDHAAEYFPALHLCAERHDLLAVIGWSLTAGLVRPVAVVVAGVFSQHRLQMLFVVDQDRSVHSARAVRIHRSE